MDALSRRSALQRALDVLLVGSLVELSKVGSALAAITPAQRSWWRSLHGLCSAVNTASTTPAAWQRDVEALTRAVALPALLDSVDFEQLRRAFERESTRRRARGPIVTNIELSMDSSEPPMVYRRRLFALPSGQAIVPHGHNNLASAFLVLRGSCHGRHWDRARDEGAFSVLRPTIDRVFSAGDASTISDERDNVHWFQALREPVYLLNISVNAAGTGRFGRLATGRLYLDPTVPARGDGTVLAPHLSSATARARFA